MIKLEKWLPSRDRNRPFLEFDHETARGLTADDEVPARAPLQPRVQGWDVHQGGVDHDDDLLVRVVENLADEAVLQLEVSRAGP